MKLKNILIVVEDIEKSKKFYHDLFHLDLILDQDIRELYEAFSCCLKPQEQSVVKLRYGLFGVKPCTQREIAGQLGISRSYVSRIEKRALKKLGEHLETAQNEIIIT